MNPPHKDNDGKIDIKGDIISSDNGEGLVLQKLSRPLDFDFSTLSESDIEADLKPALDALKAEECLKSKLKPLLVNDLYKKAHAPLDKFRINKIPYLIGGMGGYEVYYHISDQGEVDIETFSIKRDQGHGFFLQAIPYPPGFDYSKLTKNEISDSLNKALSEDACDQRYRTNIVKQMTELTHKFLNDGDIEERKDRRNVSEFLGGLACYNFSYYIENGSPVVDSFYPGYQEDMNGIILTKKDGPSAFKFL